MASEPVNPYEVKKKSAVGWCILWFFIGMLIPIGTLGIFLGVVPADTLIGWFYKSDSAIVSDKLKGQSVISILTQMNDLTIGDFPVLKSAVDGALANSDFDKYLTIDWDAIADVRFTSSTLSSDLSAALVVHVSLEDLENDGFLALDPTFQKLPCFSQWVEVEAGKELDKTAPGLYYYKLEDGSYARALDDSGNYIEPVTSETQLYYVNLYESNIMESLSVLAKRLMVEKAKDLLAVMANAQEGSMLANVVGDRLVEELGELDADNLYISTFIDKDDPGTNQTIIDLISAYIRDKEWDAITLADLTSDKYNADDITLNSIMPVSEVNADTRTLIEQVVGAPWEQIRVYDLKNTEGVNNIRFTAFKPYEGNEALYKVLIDALQIKKIYDTDGTYLEEDTAGTITMESLDNFSVDNIHLSNVLPLEGNEQIYGILTDLSNDTPAADLTISSLNNLQQENFNNISLYRVLPCPTEAAPTQNKTIYDILLEATGKSFDGTDYTIYQTVKVGSLSTFEISRVKLTTVLPQTDTNTSLYTILLDMTGATSASELTVGSLSEVDVSKIKIFNVLNGQGSDVQGNAFLKALYESNPNLTVANMGSALNNLSLSVIYGPICWTKDQTKAVKCNIDDTTGSGYPVYTLTKGTDASGNAIDIYNYNFTSATVTETNDNYYVSNQAGCWLIFCNTIVYDDAYTGTDKPSGYINTGRPITITQASTTLSDLEDDSSSIAGKITDASIYTMILTRLMADGNYLPTVLEQSIQDLVDAVSVTPSTSTPVIPSTSFSI